MYSRDAVPPGSGVLGQRQHPGHGDVRVANRGSDLEAVGLIFDGSETKSRSAWGRKQKLDKREGRVKGEEGNSNRMRRVAIEWGLKNLKSD